MTTYDVPDTSTWDNYGDAPEYRIPDYEKDTRYKDGLAPPASPADLSDDCRKIPRTEDEYYR
jgi:hypothetical protein